jgi:cell division protein FtsB
MDRKRRKQLWIAGIIVIVCVLATGKGVRSFYLRRQELKKVEVLYKDSQKRVMQKQWRVDRAAKDDAFLEREARKQLGLVGDNELEFRWTPSPKLGARADENK